MKCSSFSTCSSALNTLKADLDLRVLPSTGSLKSSRTTKAETTRAFRPTTEFESFKSPRDQRPQPDVNEPIA